MSSTDPVPDDAGSAAPASLPQTEDFTTCYRTEKLNVVRFLMSQGASEHDAHDAAQAAFMRALRHWNTIRNPRRWLFTVARREYLAARAPETPIDPLAKVPEVPSFSSPIEIHEQAGEVLAVLKTLPVKQRQVMALAVDAFSPGDIARRLLQDPESVRQNLYRARQSLKPMFRN